ncbi:MAG: DNA-binding response regulator [Eubacteriales bacterium]|nr:DNA-binding response regulator [Eubacteriales bacterium]
MKEKLCILEAVDQPRDAVWDALEPYAEVTTVRDGACAYQLLCEQEFDLALLNLTLYGMDGLELLRRIKKRDLCPLVVLTSEFPDFQYAQQGILYGAFDYLLRPLTEKALVDLLFRAQQRLRHTDDGYRKECAGLVRAIGLPDIAARYDAVVSRLSQPDGVQRDVTVRRLYEAVIWQAFAEMPWLEQFVYLEDYDAIDWIRTTGHTIVCDFCRRKLCEFSRTVAVLYPHTKHEKLQDILSYILTHVDNGYRQKDVAAAFYISSAALSDLFRTELGRSYRAYMTDVRMLRAEYLLRHSDMKVYEISALLGYKDAEYFSRVFRQRYHVPLSQFRRENQMDYQI